MCIAGGYIMENTCVVGQELTLLEECHGHECLMMKRPSHLLGPNSLKGTLGSSTRGENETTCRLQLVRIYELIKTLVLLNIDNLQINSGLFSLIENISTTSILCCMLHHQICFINVFLKWEYK